MATGIDKILNVGLEILGTAVAGNAGKDVAGVARSGADWAATEATRSVYNNKLSQISKNPNAFFDTIHYDATNPMFWIQRLFNQGKWLNTY